MSMSDEPRYHECDPSEAWREYDAQGIYLCRVCKVCRAAKLNSYRPEILTGYSQADIDEPIDPEDGPPFADEPPDDDFWGYGAGD